MISRKVASVWSTSLAILVACVALFQTRAMAAAPVAVRHTEGLVHGFLVLRTLSGDTLADGVLIQIARGYRVTGRLVFRFKDGSVHDETAVFSQRGNFRLLSDHLIQKGPAFQHVMEVLIHGPTGQITVRNTRRRWQGEGADQSPRPATGRGQWHGSHATEEHSIRCIADDGVDGGGHTKAAASEARNHFARRGAILDRGLQSQSHALRRESGDRGRRRARGAAAGEATTRHPRLDSRWGGSSLRQIGRLAFFRRPRLAD